MPAGRVLSAGCFLKRLQRPCGMARCSALCDKRWQERRREGVPGAAHQTRRPLPP
jgi:hypothetical protein